MNIQEQRLKDGLHRLADPIEPNIELVTVVAAGERLRKTRRTRWAGIGALAVATVVILGGLAWPTFDRGLPAVPEPIGSPASPGEPEPVSGSVRLGFDIFDESDLGFRSVDVIATHSGDIAAVRVTAESLDGALTTGAFEAAKGVFGSVQVAPGLVVALVPEPVRAIVALDGLDSHVDAAEISELGVTAVGIQSQQGNSFDGLVWEGTDGVVRNSLGKVVPSAELTYQVRERGSSVMSSRSLVLFRDETLAVWGYIDRNDDTRLAHPLASQPTGSVAGISAVSEGGYLHESTVVGFLPPGGTDPDLELGVANARWTSAELGNSGWTVFVAVADQIAVGQDLVERVAYTDSSGSRVTYQPR